MSTGIIIAVIIAMIGAAILWVYAAGKRAEKAVRLQEVVADKEKIIVAVKEKQNLANSITNVGLSDDALRERVRLERDQLRDLLQPK